MVYSLDLRKRVLDFIATGGSKTEASRRFSVARSTLYKWLNAPDPFKRHKPGPRRPRTLDPDALVFQTRPTPNAQRILVSQSLVSAMD